MRNDKGINCVHEGSAGLGGPRNEACDVTLGDFWAELFALEVDMCDSPTVSKLNDGDIGSSWFAQ